MNEFCRKLGLRLPVIQAPMAGGPSSQELVAACSAAGVLGSFGFAYTQPEEMKKQCAWVRSKTDRPFGVNLFVAPLPAQIGVAAQRGALEAVAGYYAELGLPAPEPVKEPYAPDLEAQLAAVEAIAPRVFTVHLGALGADRVKRFQRADQDSSAICSRKSLAPAQRAAGSLASAPSIANASCDAKPSRPNS